MSRVAVNGIELNVEVSGKGPALLLLHGFTGDATTWEPFRDAWSGFRCFRVDIIGHGRSDAPADARRYSMAHAVEDLVAVLDALDIEETALVGYSMGGRLALHLALAAPERLTALVLESASPGIEDRKDRVGRRRADAALAAAIERDGLEAFVDRWQAQALFASQQRLPDQAQGRQREQRLRQSPVGLANSLRGMGAGGQDYVLETMDRLSLPVLLLAGALDRRYVDFVAEMTPRLAHGQPLIIPDAGHAVHLEQPEAFSRAVTDFLTRVEGTTATPTRRGSARDPSTTEPFSQSSPPGTELR